MGLMNQISQNSCKFKKISLYIGNNTKRGFFALDYQAARDKM